MTYQKFISVNLWAETKRMGREMALESNEPFVALIDRLIRDEFRNGDGPGEDFSAGQVLTTAKIRLETIEVARLLMMENRESFAELAHRLLVDEKNRRKSWSH